MFTTCLQVPVEVREITESPATAVQVFVSHRVGADS